MLRRHAFEMFAVFLSSCLKYYVEASYKWRFQEPRYELCGLMPAVLAHYFDVILYSNHADQIAIHNAENELEVTAIVHFVCCGKSGVLQAFMSSCMLTTLIGLGVVLLCSEGMWDAIYKIRLPHFLRN